MGVFDRFFRRKDDAPAEEAGAAAPAAESGTATEAEETEEAGTGPAELKAPAAEAVEIPKQQSAEAAADSEAGEGARK